MNKPTKIYVLRDPETGEVRYVGKTTQRLCSRLTGHMQCNPETHSGRWIKLLRDKGLRPLIELIEEAGDDWPERERHWISHYRDSGASLTNLSQGGDGHNGFHTSEETRAKLSAASKGKKRPGISAKLSAAFKGRVVSDQTREKIAAGLRGKEIPAEVRERISATLTGRTKPPRTAEHCQKIADRAKGRKRSEETKAEVAAKLKGREFSEEHRRKLSEAAKRRRVES